MNGVPVNGAAVDARYVPDPNVAPLSRRTNANGRFDCGQVLAGQWAVTVNFSTAWAVAETLTVPSPSARLQVVPSSTILGVALLQSASVHANTSVGVPFPLATTETASSGAFTLVGLAPGTWRATFVHSGYRDTSVVFTMPLPGSTLRIQDVLLTRVNYNP